MSLVVATIGDVDELELSSDPLESPAFAILFGDLSRFRFFSFLILVNRTGCSFFVGGGSLTPETSMISPERLRGRGGGGRRLGSVGLSDIEEDDGTVASGRIIRREDVGGGVIGRARRGGDGDGDGGRPARAGLALDFLWDFDEWLFLPRGEYDRLRE